MKLRLISEGEHKDAFGTHKWKTYAQIPTNADRIRAMSDEELAELLVHNPWMREETALDWLKQEVTTNSTT